MPADRPLTVTGTMAPCGSGGGVLRVAARDSARGMGIVSRRPGSSAAWRDDGFLIARMAAAVVGAFARSSQGHRYGVYNLKRLKRGEVVAADREFGGDDDDGDDVSSRRNMSTRRASFLPCTHRRHLPSPALVARAARAGGGGCALTPHVPVAASVQSRSEVGGKNRFSIRLVPGVKK